MCSLEQVLVIERSLWPCCWIDDLQCVRGREPCPWVPTLKEAHEPRHGGFGALAKPSQSIDGFPDRDSRLTQTANQGRDRKLRVHVNVAQAAGRSESHHRVAVIEAPNQDRNRILGFGPYPHQVILGGHAHHSVALVQ